MERLLFAPRALPHLRPDVAEDQARYGRWITQQESSPPALGGAGPAPRKLTLVMPIEGEPAQPLIASLQSLERQTSSHWRLVIVIDGAWRTTLTALLTVSGVRRSSQRVRILATDGPRSPGEMFGFAVGFTPDSDVALIYPGDIWPPRAVDVLGRTIQPWSVVYADEDRVETDGTHHSPKLKPAFSPEYLLHHFYTGRPLVIGTEVAAQLEPGTLLATNAFEHDLALRVTEIARQVDHVPEVLCHSAAESAPPCTENDQAAQPVISALARRREHGVVGSSQHDRTFRIQRTVDPALSASIIIPFRDEPQFLRTCVDSIEATTGGLDIEVLLIDNGSVGPETAALIEMLDQRPSVRVSVDTRPFNWAALNNTAARQARGNVLVFLNNDIEAIGEGWLGALLAQASRPDVGAVGARLLYPDHRLQHCGVVIGMGGAAGHVLAGLDQGEPGYLHMAVTTRECAAVTGACLGTRRDVFEALGGFDESLGVDLNDIDYCLRLQRQGLRVIVETEAELIHYESPSRGTAGGVGDIVHFLDRWDTTITQGDPYLNENLTRMDSSCALRDLAEDEWWHQWRSNLSQST